MKIKKSILNEIIIEELQFELTCRELIAEAEKFDPNPKAELPAEAKQAPKNALQAVIAGYKESSASQDLAKVADNFKVFLKKQGYGNPCDYVKDPTVRMKLEDDAESLSMQTKKLEALLNKLETEQVTLEEVLENMKSTGKVLKALTIVSVLGKVITMPAGKYDLIGGDGFFASMKKFVVPDAMHQFEVPNITGIDTATWGTLGAAMASLWFANSVYRYLLKKGIPCGVAKLVQGIAPIVSASARVAFSVAKGLAKWTYGWLSDKIRKIPKLYRRAKLTVGDEIRTARKIKGKPQFIDPDKLSEFKLFMEQLEQISAVSKELRSII